MNQRILLVDDEQHLLNAITRQLGSSYDLTPATGPFEGLEAVSQGPEFAVIVSDMRMPGMDGVRFLAKVREESPNSVRMMLTGNSDSATAVQAVNEGNVFRFLNKPADKEALVKAFDACLGQYRLVAAEQELLEKTLSGSIKVLVEILASVNPGLFGKAQSLKANATKLATALKAADIWQIEIAAMLCQIGSLALPPGMASVRNLSDENNPTERISLIGSSLVSKIPRLEAVSDAILYQDQHFDGTGFPGDGKQGEALPLAARILKVLKDLETLTERHESNHSALCSLQTRTGWYDPNVLEAAMTVFGTEAGHVAGITLLVADLAIGDTLGSNLTTKDGLLLASAGQMLSDFGYARIASYIEKGLLDHSDIVYVVRRFAEAA